MAELLKLVYSPLFIEQLSSAIQAQYSAFDKQAFTSAIFDRNWPEKELKQRMRHITLALKKYLPDDYQRCLDIIVSASPIGNGFAHLFFPDYVALYGLHDFTVSMRALEKITPYASAEFAIRPFIKAYPDLSMAKMNIWAESPNPHVRRLASEGCRPRLPWAESLPDFKKDPSKVLQLLDKLKHDDSKYVQRSVANNLNDISKDHPQQVLEIAERWLGDNAQTDRLVKHACRTLLKQGHQQTLLLFGLEPPNHIQLHDFKVEHSVLVGQHLCFSFILTSTNKPLGQLRLEYAIDFLRSNGQHNRKIFKLSESNIKIPHKVVQKKHSFKIISTRVYYPGKQHLAIVVNGIELATQSFELR